jgi:hypothetical protein
MRYKYIELCYFYAGFTYLCIIKMTICVLSNSYIKYNALLILYDESYCDTLQHYNKYGEGGRDAMLIML